MPQEEHHHWEKDVIQEFAFAALREQRAKRRWSIFFKLVWLFIIILILLFVFVGPREQRSVLVGKPHAALIKITGPITSLGQTSASNINKALRLAFEDKNTKGVVLDINSPGGSAVQSNLIFQTIMSLRKKHPKIKLYAVCGDVCASGAYYVAAASDKIYANPSSLVGSIGVILPGFGFVDTLQKLGMQRRVFKAGIHKDFLDPFAPLQTFDVQHAKKMLKEVHQQFIENVKQGRGKRLKNEPIIFSGLIWDGIQAKKLGVIDDFADQREVVHNVLKVKYVADYTIRPNPLQRFVQTFGSAFGAAVGHSVVYSMQGEDTGIQARGK